MAPGYGSLRLALNRKNKRLTLKEAEEGKGGCFLIKKQCLSLFAIFSRPILLGVLENVFFGKDDSSF